MNPQTVKLNTIHKFYFHTDTSLKRNVLRFLKMPNSFLPLNMPRDLLCSILLMHVSVNLEYMHLTTRSRLFKSWIALSTIVLGKRNALSFG